MKKHMFQHPDWLELDRGTMHEKDCCSGRCSAPGGLPPS